MMTNLGQCKRKSSADTHESNPLKTLTMTCIFVPLIVYKIISSFAVWQHF